MLRGIKKIVKRKSRQLSAIALSAALAIGTAGCVFTSKNTSTARDDTSTATLSTRTDDNEVHAVNLDEWGRALRGYDPVAYFTDGAAVSGQSDISLEWNGATWYFANETHRDTFRQDPDKYAPANGGFCTFGVVLAKKFDGDPEVWSIRNNRLYVFLNEEVKVKFLQDSAGNLRKVVANWPEIEHKPAITL